MIRLKITICRLVGFTLSVLKGKRTFIPNSIKSSCTWIGAWEHHFRKVIHSSELRGSSQKGLFSFIESGAGVTSGFKMFFVKILEL